MRASKSILAAIALILIQLIWMTISILRNDGTQARIAALVIIAALLFMNIRQWFLNRS